jgi:UDP-N-acetylmuramoyl-L-alanyl-D-glutamate--2,6-diaminopimelate ligase
VSRVADPVVTAKRIAIAEAAIERYGHPSSELRIVGVTGTNGKTTTTNLLRAVLDSPESPSASIGTLGVLLGADGAEVPGGLGLTTPGPDELHRVLRELVTLGVRDVVMEVSSHALDQHRVHGIEFAAAVFTSFTRDHLDYHETMEAYFAAKARLVSYLGPNGCSVINSDEPAWNHLPPSPRWITFGLNGGDVRARDIEFDATGSRWTLTYGGEAAPVRLPLMGDFNVANALAAAASAIALGATVQEAAARLDRVPQVPGRLEVIAKSPVVIRDYSHTPDSLERAILAVRPFVRRRLIVVFGAGGDRDPGKRPMMGGIADRLADVAIVTSDNPRTENPDAIIDQIESGMTTGHERITDRRQAIARAIALAGPGDVVLLAGKGHETYQVIGTDKLPFDEREIVREIVGAGK